MGEEDGGRGLSGGPTLRGGGDKGKRKVEQGGASKAVDKRDAKEKQDDDHSRSSSLSAPSRTNSKKRARVVASQAKTQSRSSDDMVPITAVQPPPPPPRLPSTASRGAFTRNSPRAKRTISKIPVAHGNASARWGTSVGGDTTCDAATTHAASEPIAVSENSDVAEGSSLRSSHNRKPADVAFSPEVDMARKTQQHLQRNSHSAESSNGHSVYRGEKQAKEGGTQVSVPVIATSPMSPRNAHSSDSSEGGAGPRLRRVLQERERRLAAAAAAAAAPATGSQPHTAPTPPESRLAGVGRDGRTQEGKGSPTDGRAKSNVSGSGDGGCGERGSLNVAVQVLDQNGEGDSFDVDGDSAETPVAQIRPNDCKVTGGRRNSSGEGEKGGRDSGRRSCFPSSGLDCGDRCEFHRSSEVNDSGGALPSVARVVSTKAALDGVGSTARSLGCSTPQRHITPNVYRTSNGSGVERKKSTKRERNGSSGQESIAKSKRGGQEGASAGSSRPRRSEDQLPQHAMATQGKDLVAAVAVEEQRPSPSGWFRNVKLSHVLGRSTNTRVDKNSGAGDAALPESSEARAEQRSQAAAGATLPLTSTAVAPCAAAAGGSGLSLPPAPTNTGTHTNGRRSWQHGEPATGEDHQAPPPSKLVLTDDTRNRSTCFDHHHYRHHDQQQQQQQQRLWAVPAMEGRRDRFALETALLAPAPPVEGTVAGVLPPAAAAAAASGKARRPYPNPSISEDYWLSSRDSSRTPGGAYGGSYGYGYGYRDSSPFHGVPGRATKQWSQNGVLIPSPMVIFGDNNDLRGELERAGRVGDAVGGGSAGTRSLGTLAAARFSIVDSDDEEQGAGYAGRCEVGRRVGTGELISPPPRYLGPC